MKDTIALFASARRNGNTGKLIDWVADELQIEVIDLSTKTMSPFDYEHKNSEDDFVPLLKQVLEYQKLVFVTPIYWYAASAQMKVFIDRTSDLLDVDDLIELGRMLRGKTAYVVCTSISVDADQSFINSMSDTFEYLGMNYGGCLHANCENGYEPEKYKEDVSKFIKLLRSPGH